MITVISGELSAGRGTTFAEDALKTYKAGTFFVVPANAPHFAFAKNGEVIYQESGMGPTPSFLVKQ
jgi:quercetin dioxygenase-like cupin family protein